MTLNFVIYDKTGKILSTGHCQKTALHKQAGENQFAMEGMADAITQKVEFSPDGEPRIVDKSPVEIEKDNPKTKEKPFAKKLARITNEDVQALVARLVALEKKVAR